MNMPILRISSAFSLCLCVSVVNLSSADWPVFRGNPHQTGVAGATQPVPAELPDKLDVLWTFRAKEAIEGTPAIVGGVVYLGALDEQLYALDLKTGKEKWHYKAGPVKVPVSVLAGRVYAGNLDGVFHCVDAANGQKVWTFDAGAEVTSGASFTKGRVLFGCNDESLYCLSDKGEKLWTFRVQGGPVLATPAIAEGHTFVAGCDATLHVLDAATGKELKSVELGGQIGATAAVVGEHLYVGTMTNQVLGIDWKAGKIAWTFEAPRLQQPFYSSPAVTDKLVIVGGRDKRVWALDRKTGKDVWSFATGGRVDSSPVIVGDRVYVGSLDKHLYVLDVAAGKQLAKIALDGAVIGSPAVADSRLLIGTEKGTLYCFGAKE